MDQIIIIIPSDYIELADSYRIRENCAFFGSRTCVGGKEEDGGQLHFYFHSMRVQQTFE